MLSFMRMPLEGRERAVVPLIEAPAAHTKRAATWGLGLSDESDANYTQLLGSFGSATKRYGYSSPDMDAAIESLRVADTDAKKIAAYKTISEIWLRDNPALVITYIPSAVIMSPKVHGIDRTGQSMTLFDKTWMEK